MKKISMYMMMAGLVLGLASCESTKNENPEGRWTSPAPKSVTESVVGATSATEILTFDFATPVNGAPGVVTLTGDYDITMPKATETTDSVAAPTSYKVTATIKGTWMQSVDDKDEYLLTFDRNSLSVSGVDAPELGPVTDVFLKQLPAFTAIEDVEVSKDGQSMKFETKNPDVDYHFVQVK